MSFCLSYLSGVHAILESTGETFEQVKETRAKEEKLSAKALARASKKSQVAK